MRFFLIGMLVARILSFPIPALANTADCSLDNNGNSCTTTTRIASTIVNPTSQTDTHDIRTSHTQFLPGQTVTFHITVQNTGSIPLSNAIVTNVFPQYINFSSGPGSFDNGTKALTFPLGTLAPHQSQIFTVTGVVEDNLPTGGPVCVNNLVYVATADNRRSDDVNEVCMHAAVVSPTAAIPLSNTPSTSSRTSSPSPTFDSPQVIRAPATGPSALWLSLIPLGFCGYIVGQFATKKLS